ncbi:biopolymer transporter ExbD, partial [Acinetobacter baumannii]
VTTTYSKFTALQVTLPTADAQKALEQPFEINIAIDANGRYAINNKRIAARDAQGLSEEMQAAVRSSGSKTDPVIII